MASDDTRDVQAATGHGFTALSLGTRLSDRYVIDHVIAHGGFGITYGGRHEGLNRVVAIKEHFPRQFAYRDGTTSEVRPSDPGTYAWALDRFLQEGRALATCKHPHVVDVSDVFEANGTAYMVLGYEEGQSFAAWLAALGLPPTQAELDAILAPLLDALAFVHDKGLLHRDIAPDNIMIRRDGKPCLIDFGAARKAMAQRSQVMSAIVKTGYSPPEQYTTTGRNQGPWSDIYAFGATLYLAVTGLVPPEATERTLGDTMRPAVEAAAGRGYRPGFLAAIDAALCVPKAERPQTVAAWRVLSEGGDCVRTSAIGLPPTAPPLAPRTTTFTDLPRPSAPPRRSRAQMFAASVAVMALAAFATNVGGLWATPWQLEAQRVTAAKARAEDETKRRVEAAEAETRRSTEEKAKAEVAERKRIAPLPSTQLSTLPSAAGPAGPSGVSPPPSAVQGTAPAMAGVVAPPAWAMPGLSIDASSLGTSLGQAPRLPPQRTAPGLAPAGLGARPAGG